MRSTYVVRDGKVVPKVYEPAPDGQYVSSEGDTRILAIQLPRNYKHAKRFVEKGPFKGTAICTTREEARELARRASGEGEGIAFDR